MCLSTRSRRSCEFDGGGGIFIYFSWRQYLYGEFLYSAQSTYCTHCMAPSFLFSLHQMLISLTHCTRRCGPMDQLTSLSSSRGSPQMFLTLSVMGSLTLRSVGVGPLCMLCPTLSNNCSTSAKSILVVLDRGGLQQFRDQMVRKEQRGGDFVFFCHQLLFVFLSFRLTNTTLILLISHTIYVELSSVRAEGQWWQWQWWQWSVAGFPRQVVCARNRRVYLRAQTPVSSE